MWVYETDMMLYLILQFIGYESPCGFMSSKIFGIRKVFFLLRIPMWVYEINLNAVHL